MLGKRERQRMTGWGGRAGEMSRKWNSSRRIDGCVFKHIVFIVTLPFTVYYTTYCATKLELFYSLTGYGVIVTFQN